MKRFTVLTASIEESGAGILKENDRAVSACGARCIDIETIKLSCPLGALITDPSSASVSGNGLLYVDKRSNSDLILAVRAALTFGAEGVVIPFGNNKNRPYVKEGRAYTTEETVAAIWEAKRLAPLFGREFCGELRDKEQGLKN